MTDLHYEFTGETRVNQAGVTLHRIRATRDMPKFAVSAGDEGGWVEDTKNLSGNAWVFGDAWVFGKARVSNNAQVFGSARVYGDAWVYGNALVSNNAQVFGSARVSGNAWVFGDAWVFGKARVSNNAQVFGSARVYGNAWVYGNARVSDSAEVSGNAEVFGDARVYGNADYMHITTYTSQRLLTTLFKEKDGKHTIKMGCWSGTVEELEALFKRDEWVDTSGDDADEAREEMLALCQVFRARIARWGNDPEN